MWLVAMFDLPVDTKAAKRAYQQFRKRLVKQGFLMLQYSVYARYCQSDEAATVHRKRIRESIPFGGNVRLVAVTDHQFAKMEVYRGKTAINAEDPPPQLLLF